MKYRLKAKQLLSTEHGAKSAGEVFEKEATPEEIELGVQLGLYEQLRITNDELRIDEGQPGAKTEGSKDGDNPESEIVKPTPSPSQGEGGKAKKGGKQK
jgi:hypothetical protein